MIEELSIETSVIEDVDVLVCGGGPAGIAASIAASRHGARTMLIEQFGCLGGVATNCLVGTWHGSYSRNGKYPVVGGIFSEIVEKLVAEGAAIPAQRSGKRHVGYASWHSPTVPFEYEPCKRICEQLVLKAGVKLRYFTTSVMPQLKDNKIAGMFVHSKNGMEFIKSGTIVDATGDADIAFQSGCPTIKGESEQGLMSAAGMIFVVEDVDSQAFERYCLETDDVRFRKVIADLEQKGQWHFPFKAINCCEMPRRGNFYINTLLLPGIDGTNADDLTRGMIEGRQKVVELMEQMAKIVPGFAKARITQISPMIGIRDTRRIVGEYRVSVKDIVQGKQFHDTIVLSGYQWDMADPKRVSYQQMWGTEIAREYSEIPYRSLIPKGIDNLIVAGRSVSSDWDVLGIFRIMPACFAMGQAAGIAAIEVANKKISFKDVNIDKLREALQQDGAILSSK